MVKEILTGAGFIEDETFRETRFLSPPAVTYAVYMDSVSRGGGDNLALLKRHTVTIEVYEYAPDPEAEKLIEDKLDQAFASMVDGWEKQDRYWIQEEQLYQVVYTFEHIEK